MKQVIEFSIIINMAGQMAGDCNTFNNCAWMFQSICEHIFTQLIAEKYLYEIHIRASSCLCLQFVEENPTKKQFTETTMNIIQ